MRTLRYTTLTSALLLLSTGCSRFDEWWAAVKPADGQANADASATGDAHAAPSDGSARPHTPRPNAHDASTVAHADASTDASASGDAGYDAEVLPANGPTMTALWVWVPVFQTMNTDGPKSGYLRGGARARLISATPLGTGNGCPRGWYQIEGGGYMCLNRMTSLNPEELGNRRPSQPDLSAPMPYPYMTTYRAATMYRWLPSEADMREVEPARFGIVPATPDPAAPATATPTGALLTTGVPTTGTTAVVTTTATATPTTTTTTTTTTTATPGTPTTTTTTTTPTVATRAQAEDAGVRIEDLQGTGGTPLLRRMLAGMYISIDREVTGAGRRFWRTQNGGFVERGAVSALRTAPTFQGITIDEAHPLPMAFMVAFEGWTYDLSPDMRTATRRERSPRLTAYHLTSDPPVTIGRNEYWKTRDGFWVTARNTRQVRTTPPPSDVGATEKWIEVNLDRQMLIAYEGARPVYVTLVSTGRRNRDDETRNYETIQGGFRIQSKHVAATMDGNSAGDGPYSIEDVPWVMYFENSFAMHGAFWHNLFGYMRSHGCVNMAPADARWVFHWSEPHLPPGWHGVNANSIDRPGTRIYVHYEGRPLGERGGPRSVPQH